MSPHAKRLPWPSDRTIAVTGSKGGVGKTNLVANVAVALARLGRSVVVIDGDLGLANLDVLLGLSPGGTIEQLLDGSAEPESLFLEGPAGIRILPAASGVPGLTRLDAGQRERLFRALGRIAAGVDDVLIDTGAGLGETTLSMQLAASRVLVVTTPEPTSLVDAYATLKVLWDADPDKRIDLVVNGGADDLEAEKIHRQICKASRHFLGREPGWIGAVHYDPEIRNAVRRQRVVTDIRPASPAARCYERLALRLSIEHGSQPIRLETGPELCVSNEETYH